MIVKDIARLQQPRRPPPRNMEMLGLVRIEPVVEERDDAHREGHRRDGDQREPFRAWQRGRRGTGVWDVEIFDSRPPTPDLGHIIRAHRKVPRSVPHVARNAPLPPRVLRTARQYRLTSVE